MHNEQWKPWYNVMNSPLESSATSSRQLRNFEREKSLHTTPQLYLAAAPKLPFWHILWRFILIMRTVFMARGEEHTGAKTNFLSRNYLEFSVEKKCEFCEKWCSENVNFVKNVTFEIVNFVTNEILKLWILWKMRFSKCEFCQKCDFWNCEFCEKWDFEIMNFVKITIFNMWIYG